MKRLSAKDDMVDMFVDDRWPFEELDSSILCFLLFDDVDDEESLWFRLRESCRECLLDRCNEDEGFVTVDWLFEDGPELCLNPLEALPVPLEVP